MDKREWWEKDLERQVRDYVSATECNCDSEKGIVCWHCLFTYNLEHLDGLKDE